MACAPWTSPLDHLTLDETKRIQFSRLKPIGTVFSRNDLIHIIVRGRLTSCIVFWVQFVSQLTVFRTSSKFEASYTSYSMCSKSDNASVERFSQSLDLRVDAFCQQSKWRDQIYILEWKWTQLYHRISSPTPHCLTNYSPVDLLSKMQQC